LQLPLTRWHESMWYARHRPCSFKQQTVCEAQAKCDSQLPAEQRRLNHTVQCAQSAFHGPGSCVELSPSSGLFVLQSLLCMVAAAMPWLHATYQVLLACLLCMLGAVYLYTYQAQRHSCDWHFVLTSKFLVSNSHCCLLMCRAAMMQIRHLTRVPPARPA
jgi:hypothetical protein